jgi:hypothetical protein
MSLYGNIAAKKARIKAGSGEKMRKVGAKGAPAKGAFKAAADRKETSKKEESVMGISNNEHDDFEDQWEEDAIEEAIEDAAIEADMKRQDAEIEMEKHNGGWR